MPVATAPQRRSVDRLRRLGSAVLCACLALPLGGCGDDASSPDTGATVDVTDAHDAAADSSTTDDAGAPTDTDGDVDSGAATPDATPALREPNPCGGVASLAEQPGTPCGDCFDGRWVCDGVDALRCHGAQVERNACGTCEPLAGTPGAACGCAGVMTCDGVGLICSDTVERNACGGCAALPDDLTVGQACANGDGVVVCAGPNEAVCRVGDANACGVSGPLVSADDALEGAHPGDVCGTCGQGVVVCGDGVSRPLVCVDGDQGVNACGTCAVLPAEPDSPCGCGDSGRWVCDSRSTTGLRCEGAAQENDCGGCASLDNAPGMACEDGIWACAGPDAVSCIAAGAPVCGADDFAGNPGALCGDCGDGVLLCDAARSLTCSGASARNICGGCGTLPGEPGAVCAAGRVWECQEDGTLECSAARGRNACGGVGEISATPGDACGACGGGVVLCISDEDVACLGDLQPNACGGCGDLRGTPGRACGVCNTGHWACDGPEDVRCAGEDVDAEFLSYADVDEDGYGDPNVTAEVCPGTPGYVRTPGDCDDGRDDVYRGAVELCDGHDNNCNGEVDESFIAFADTDADGFGDPNAAAIVCGTVTGFVDNGYDCYDQNPLVFPGQTLTFTDERGDGSFDYDCDGVVTFTYPVFGTCGAPPLACDLAESGRQQGWWGTDTLPACGEEADYALGCLPSDDGCEAQIRQRTQECR